MIFFLGFQQCHVVEHQAGSFFLAVPKFDRADNLGMLENTFDPLKGVKIATCSHDQHAFPS